MFVPCALNTSPGLDPLARTKLLHVRTKAVSERTNAGRSGRGPSSCPPPPVGLEESSLLAVKTVQRASERASDPLVAVAVVVRSMLAEVPRLRCQEGQIALQE